MQSQLEPGAIRQYTTRVLSTFSQRVSLRLVGSRGAHISSSSNKSHSSNANQHAPQCRDRSSRN